ncbi:MAG: hypothetical protein AAGG11_22490 [Pseudomonadota bacterium]
MRHAIFALFGTALLVGCATRTEVTTYDFSSRAGLYVLGYTTQEELRRAVEDRLVADIKARDMVAFASYVDLPVLEQTSRSSLLAAANEKQAIAILVVNQVTPGEDGVIDNPARITPEHPDLAAFYEYSKTVQRDYEPGSEVLAEVNAFLLQEDGARLIWSGTTWSFDADGQGSAISGISDNIANELSQMRDTLRAR